MSKIESYQYAVIGGGAAGLSLVYHLAKQGALGPTHRLLLVDPEIKSGHDHTWCFWERGEGPFEHLVHHQWSKFQLYSKEEELKLSLNDYRYKTIFSTQFYEHINQLISDHPYVERLVAKASNIRVQPTGVRLEVNGVDYLANWAFSSLLKDIDLRGPRHPSATGNRQRMVESQGLKAPYLDQHFRGWFIKTEAADFEPDQATLMDFRAEQVPGETRFFYVLPFTPDRALVEMAIFSNEVWTIERFDRAIEGYLDKYWSLAGRYQVYHREDGLIPMTTHTFPERDGRLIYIGLRGNQARPSTGYTFYNMQRRLATLAERLSASPTTLKVPRAWPRRHLLYDATLLRILEKDKMAGSRVFMDLFRENSTDRLLAFLNGETSLTAELGLMSSTRIRTFAPGFVRELLS